MVRCNRLVSFSIVIGLLLAFAVPSVSAQQRKSPNTPSGPVPMAFVAKSRVDIGSVVLGDEGQAVFLLENKGTADLIIEKVKSSCGCTAVNLSEEQKTIAPGGSQEIVARFDTSEKKLGEQVHSVELNLNDPRSPHLSLVFRANVESYFRILPAPLVNLRSARRGTTLPPLELTPTIVGEELVIDEVTIPQAIFDYTTEPFVADDGEKGIRLHLTVADTAQIGEVKGSVQIKGTVGNREATLPIRVSGRVVGDLDVTPLSVQSLMPTLRGRRFAPIIVSSTTDEPFDIVSAEAGPFLSIELKPRRENREYFVEMLLDESAPDGPLGTELRIRTDNVTVPLLRVPIFINVKERYRLEPEIVVLRPEDKGKRRRVRLQSAAFGKLEIHDITCSDSRFTAEADPDPFIVPSVGFIWVGFNGEPGGKEFKAELIVKTNMKGAQEVRIPVLYSDPS